MQLRDMMPTQRMIVRVPTEADNNDSRIFCSLGLQLRPSLVGWHGRPPEQGVESTVFVEGRNFSLHDTHVVAGGQPAQAVLVSRHLLKVTISRDASPIPNKGGNPLLDINVATPNGVSNHLLIEMAPPDPAAEARYGRREGRAGEDRGQGGRPRQGRSQAGSAETLIAPGTGVETVPDRQSDARRDPDALGRWPGGLFVLLELGLIDLIEGDLVGDGAA